MEEFTFKLKHYNDDNNPFIRTKLKEYGLKNEFMHLAPQCLTCIRRRELSSGGCHFRSSADLFINKQCNLIKINSPSYSVCPYCHNDIHTYISAHTHTMDPNK